MSVTRLLPIMLLLACQSSESANDAGPQVDGPVGDSVVDGGGPATPALPKSPAFVDWTCPAGWQQRPVGVGTAVEHTACRPPEQVKCEPGAMQPVDEDHCSPIGSACPAAAFADVASIRALAPGFDGPLHYVQPGAAAGDGSAAKPFGSVGQALTLAAKGSIVVLSRGTHAGPIVINQAIALVGSCVSETILEGPFGQAGDRTITIGAGGVHLANLRVTGKRGGVLLLSVSGDPVTIDSVEIAGASNFGLMVGLGQPTLELRRLVIRNVAGIAFAVGPDATISGQQLAIERASHLGLVVSDADMIARPSELSFEEVVIRDAGDGGGAANGQLVRFEGRGSVHVNRCLLERGTDIALVVKGGGSLSLTDCVLSDTRAGELGEGRGLILYDDGSAKLSRTLVESQRVVALHAWTTEAGGTPRLELSDVVVRETLAGGTMQTATGLVVSGEVKGQRVLLEDNDDTAILVATDQPNAAMTLEIVDVAVLGTRPRPADGRRGVGLIADGGKVRLERALFANNHSHGLLSGVSRADNAAPDLQLIDLTVRDTQAAKANGRHGRGLELQGSRVRIQRALLEKNRDVALLLDRTTAPDVPADRQNTNAEITDIVIRDTQSDPNQPLSGIAIVAQRGSTVSLEKARLIGSHGAALMAVQVAGLSLLDVVIDNTARSACAELPVEDPKSCAGDPGAASGAGGGGTAVAIVGPVSAELQRFEISNSALCGLQVREKAQLDASDGTIHHNLIGVNVDEGSTVESILQSTVRLYDNDVAVDTSALPVPKPIETYKFGQ